MILGTFESKENPMGRTLNPTFLNKELTPAYTTSNDIFNSTQYKYDTSNNNFPEWYRKSGYPNYLFYYHYHEFLEIIFMRKGKIRIIADFGKFTLRENEILVVNSNEVHSGFFHERAKDFVDYSVIFINLRVLESKTGANVRDVFKNLFVGKTKVKNHITPDVDGYDRVKEIVLQTSERYINYASNGKTIPELVQMGNAISVLSEFDACDLIYTTRKEPKTKETDFSVRLLNYVQSNYRDRITTKTASNFFSYDEAQFCRLFKKHFNMTFIKFLNFYRIKMACCYNIADKSMTIENVAKDVGYDNYSYFCRNFKKYIGKTPKEFFHNTESDDI